MNKKTKLKKITKQIFPATQYSWKERKIHQKNLYEEMTSFWNSHPEYSVDDVIRTYCDEESINILPSEKNLAGGVKLVLILLCIVVLIGLFIFFVSNSWNAPTIHL
nr:hypothetical protein [Eubacterium sp.]